MKLFRYRLLYLLLVVFLAACGGGGTPDDTNPPTDDTNPPTTAIGQFKDSNIAGISYVSGEQSGVTGSDGSFTYEVGETVTFSIGGVTIGTSIGKSIITPIDFVSGGSSSSVEVQNIVRFLLMLDDNGDQSDGINISPSVQTIAESWSQVDFSTADLSSELVTFISDAASVDGGLHTLPDADAARAHLESTLRCSYAGAYKGTFSGDDSGSFGFLVDASNGNVTGIAYSTVFDEYAGLIGMVPISYDQDVAFVSGIAGEGGTFGGQFTSVNEVSGSWQTGPDGGSFSGSRIGGAVDAAFRFTGVYSGGGFGLFTFDVSESNDVTGVAYSISDDELLPFSGTVSGTSLTVSASDGSGAVGTLNTATGELSGTWDDPVESLSGTFFGSGCALN